MNMQKLRQALQAYAPYNEQEKNDRSVMLELLETQENLLVRDNLTAHFSASSWLLNREHTKVLMVYHNLYHSWSWTGGHADGEADLLAVAVREAMEETGVTGIRALSDKIFSVEILTVDGHVKRGVYVPSHLHLNVTYLLEADEREALHAKPDENSGVKWFPFEEALTACTEPWMVERIYAKLNRKLLSDAWRQLSCQINRGRVEKAGENINHIT
ncbi:MAG: NUDIX hydrolase [Roseburia sp.]|nr:NUDIX hydrolase [Roseburia sp.]